MARKTNSQNTSYGAELQLISNRLKSFVQDANLAMRETVVNELLKECPVDTGFLRNHVTVSHTTAVPIIPSSDKTDEAVAALKFQGLTYQQEPSQNEIDNSLGVFKNGFPNMKEVFVLAPVEYAEILVNSAKYSEFHRKAGAAAQRKIDSEVKEIFKSA